MRKALRLQAIDKLSFTGGNNVLKNLHNVFTGHLGLLHIILNLKWQIFIMH